MLLIEERLGGEDSNYLTCPRIADNNNSIGYPSLQNQLLHTQSILYTSLSEHFSHSN